MVSALPTTATRSRSRSLPKARRAFRTACRRRPRKPARSLKTPRRQPSSNNCDYIFDKKPSPSLGFLHWNESDKRSATKKGSCNATSLTITNSWRTLVGEAHLGSELACRLAIEDLVNLRIAQRNTTFVTDEILLRYVGNIFGFFVLGEEMIERLLLAGA